MAPPETPCLSLGLFFSSYGILLPFGDRAVSLWFYLQGPKNAIFPTALCVEPGSEEVSPLQCLPSDLPSEASTYHLLFPSC